MFPWLPLLLQGAGMAGKSLFGGGDKPEFEMQPSDFKDELTLDSGDLNKMRSQNLQNISMLNTRQLSNINQVGASRRMSSGALTSAIAGSSYNAARGASAIEPGLKQAQISSVQDYLKLQQPYEMAKYGAQAESNANTSSFYGEGLGGLGKIAMLWQGGYFDKKGG